MTLFAHHSPLFVRYSTQYTYTRNEIDNYYQLSTVKCVTMHVLCKTTRQFLQFIVWFVEAKTYFHRNQKIINYGNKFPFELRL